MSLFPKNKTLVLDGAMGTLLQKNGVPSDSVLWTSLANLNAPEKVYKVHREYIEAGADIITTNTFRSNPIALLNTRYKSDDFVKKGVIVAKESIEGRKVIIAGSNSPAEDCYQKEVTVTSKELAYNHHKHISLLMEAGADFILNETQSHFDEIKIICEYCNGKIPYVISLYLDEQGKLLCGSNLEDVISYLKEQDLLAISFNCLKPKEFHSVVKMIRPDFNPGFYLNYGLGKHTDEKIEKSLPLEEHKKYTEEFYFELKPVFIGTCCGSNPEYTHIIRNIVDEQSN